MVLVKVQLNIAAVYYHLGPSMQYIRGLAGSKKWGMSSASVS
jgi:hypothetical protein